MVKIFPANAGDTGDMHSITGSGRFLGVENTSPIQYFCLENPLEPGGLQSMGKSWNSQRVGNNLGTE